jgi:hypothetical protein
MDTEAPRLPLSSDCVQVVVENFCETQIKFNQAIVRRKFLIALWSTKNIQNRITNL